MSPNPKSATSNHHQAGMDELGSFPLLEAIFGRRARRFARGMAIPDGPLKYQSKHAPLPLSKTEQMLLVLTGAGISGWNFGLPHTTTGAPNTGCNYPMRQVGRTYASAAGIHASELLWTEDSGTYITQFRDLAPEEQQEFHRAADLETLLERARRHTVQLSNARAVLPQEFPHIEAHNFWVANQPGTTLFIPIVDMTQQVLAGLAILLGERALPFDALNGRPCGNLDRFIAAGLIDPERKIALADFEQYLLGTAAAEVSIANHNIVLMLQAMGLGGWFYSGINPNSLLGGAAEEGIPGFGFRFTKLPEWDNPNPVGLDKHFEGFCPPYHADMRAGVAKFIERKFGPGGTYDPATAGPYRRNAEVKSRVHRYTPEFIECLAEVAQYIHDTFGKFPATLPSIYARFYAQAQHVDLDFYDEHFGPEAYLETHRQHMQHWHPE
jgi:hypothetical protein